MDRPRISAILITLNEEDRVAAALESVGWTDEIVVVDSGSRDDTERVARRYTDNFFVREWAGYGIQKQRAVELASGDWLLSIDADEVVSPALRTSIETVLLQPGSVAGFQILRYSHYLGHWFGRHGWRRDWQTRLFRRDSAKFPPTPIHEGVQVAGSVRRLSGPLLHYTYRDIDHHLEKMNRYTGTMAHELFAQGERSGALKPVIRGISRFLKNYLIRGGFLDGRPGIIEAGLAGCYGFLKYAKLWELERAIRHRDSSASQSGLPASESPDDATVAGAPANANDPGRIT